MRRCSIPWIRHCIGGFRDALAARALLKVQTMRDT
jgi:hypothetical protein